MNYIVDCGTPPPTFIPRIKDADRYQYFAAHSRSERWLIYHCSLKPGWRYSLLIEFVIFPKEKFTDPNLRKIISMEHYSLLMQLVCNYMCGNPTATREAILDHAFEEVSRTVGIKWGISKEDLLPIIAEGYEKEWVGKLLLKGKKE